MKIIAGNSNQDLSLKIANQLNTKLTNAGIQRFSDKEIMVEILENVRGEDCFVIQSTSLPTNDNLMELLIIIDALKRSSARRITAVIPYFGYARQDRKTTPRTPITAKLVADLITVAGAHRVLTVDLHAGQIQGFFDIPVDNLYAAPVFVNDIKKRFADKDIMVISPDIGGVVRSRKLAARLDCDLAIVDKRRDGPNISEVMHIIGDVKNRHCILIDDIIDTAGTICHAARALKEHGALSVSAYISHGVLSGPALERIEQSQLEHLILTNSIDCAEKIEGQSKIVELDLSSLLSKAMNHINAERSVSCLFE